jgi:hypothetical protein
MKKLLFIIIGCCVFFIAFSSPIHFFNSQDDELSFFSDNSDKKEASEDVGLVEEQASESTKNEQNSDQVACEDQAESEDDSESWFFSRLSMFKNFDD